MLLGDRSIHAHFAFHAKAGIEQRLMPPSGFFCQIRPDELSISPRSAIGLLFRDRALDIEIPSAFVEVFAFTHSHMRLIFLAIVGYAKENLSKG